MVLYILTQQADKAEFLYNSFSYKEEYLCKALFLSEQILQQTMMIRHLKMLLEIWILVHH